MQDEDPDGFIVRHCLTRTVRDSAAYLDVTHGPRAGDRWWAPPPQEPYQHTIRRDPPKLRVAFYTSDCDGHEVHPECKAAVDQAARLCEALGHQVGEAKPAIDVHAFNRAFVVLWATCAGYYFRAIRDLLEQRLPRPSLPLLRSRAVFGVVTRLAQTGGMRDAPFERFTHRLARIDASGSPADLWLAWRGMRLADVELARFFENYDVLLCPVLGEPPWKIGEFSDTWSDEELRQRLFAYIGTTHVANTTGLPALSVPLHLSQEGLPIGTQVLAPWAREDRLLALAAQLERAEPWHERRPPLKAESQDLAPGRPGN
jgi:amidase